ncbi:MAG TPA: S41 family peptidase [Sphingomicrobium sp.]|nr:S41 family peptidase [Sphingomicrobium sp.]
MKTIHKILPPLALVGALALVPVTTSSLAAQDAANYKELEKFMSVYERVKANYVEPVDDHTLIKGAIDGMLAALDPHSSYLQDSDFDTLRSTTDGNYGGLGLTVSIEDGAVKVIAPTEDTPAWRAGIKAGDYITHINGDLVYGESLDEAVDKMRGAPGTSVKLKIVRPGRDKPFDVSIVRERINLRPVKWEVKDGIAIIDINTFSGNAAEETRAALSAVDKATGGKPLGYILDLRSNPGGLLDQAVDISDAFLSRGEIVSQRGREKGDIERYYAKPGDMAHGLPVIVLVDVGTASAAEIVAGALQDQRRALVMGEKSFGKGSVQTVVQTGPRSALRLTTARYYTPSGRSVQAGGIDPDIAVPQLSDPDYENRPAIREADLRRHLLAQVKADDKLLQHDDTSQDPRFSVTAEELEKKGIKDFQLHYALNTLKRLGSRTAVASAGGKSGSRR